MKLKTRMYSSRMRTVRCSSRLLGKGVSVSGGVCLGGCLSGGVCLRVCLGGGVSAQGLSAWGCLPMGVSA